MSLLSTGASSLAEGSGNLASGVPTLSQGLAGVQEGSAKLASGLSTFNEQTVARIASLVGDDVRPASAKLQAIIRLAKKNDTFSGKTEGTKGRVMFTIQTAAIE